MSKPHETYKNFLAELDQVGLNLCASFSISELPDTIKASLPKNSEQHYNSLLLVGTKGGKFWKYLQQINQPEGHPFDSISLSMTQRIFAKSYSGVRTYCLYPGSEYVVPLQQLGHIVGWGRPSILGLDINQQYGTWFAYRTVLLVAESLPQTPRAETQPVCEVCVDKPCRRACPVGAVQSIGNFNIAACGDFRVQDNSRCVSKCLARLACPVGIEYRYSSEQLAHHSSFSLASIKRYRESSQW